MDTEIRLLSNSNMDMHAIDASMINSIFEVCGDNNAGYTTAHAATYLIDLAWGATDPFKRVWYRVDVELRSASTATVKVTAISREQQDRYWREGPDRFTVGELDVDGLEDCLNSDALRRALHELILPHMREQRL